MSTPKKESKSFDDIMNDVRKGLKVNNEYWEEKLFSAQGYYYSTSNKAPNTYNMIIEMDEKIDAKALRFATDKCSERYPYLMVKKKKTYKEIKLIYNNKPILVKETQNPVTLGSAETNYHQLALTFFENRLVFSVFHGLLDGTGAFEFLRTLLYYYITEKYHENPSSEKIRIVSDVISPDEYTDALKTLAVENIANLNLPWLKHKKPFRIDDDSRITRAYPYRYYIRIPKSELLTFDEKEKDMPYEKQNTIYRGRIILNSDEAYIRSKLRSLKKFYRFVEKLPLVCLKKYTDEYR